MPVIDAATVSVAVMVWPPAVFIVAEKMLLPFTRPDMNGKFQSFHVHDPDAWDLQISNQRDTSEL